MSVLVFVNFVMIDVFVIEMVLCYKISLLNMCNKKDE